MALPVGALTATITVGVSTDVTGEAGTITGLAVRPECRLVWAATGQPIEDWNAGALDAATATLVVLADQDGLVTSGTVAGVPALVAIRSWPMLAEWTVQSKDGQLRTIVRRFPAALLVAGGTLDLDLLPAHGVVPPATITYAQGLSFGPVEGVTVDDVLAEIAAHVGEADPHPQYVTEDDLPDVSDVVREGDPRLTDARTPTAHEHTAADVTGLQGALDGKQPAGSYAASAHTHAPADITGTAVITTDPRLSDARTPTAHTHAIADTTGLQTALDGKAATGHTHAELHTHANAATLDLVSGTNTGDEPDATTTTKGVVELATTAEASAGTDTTRAVTPAGVAAAIAGGGGGGVTTALYIPGASSLNGPSAPDSPALSVTGDIDIRVKATFADWGAASTWPLVSKWGTGAGGASRSYFFWLNSIPAGAPTLSWVPSAGGAPVDGRASASPAGFAPGATGWVRATLDVDNGAGGWTVNYYTSTDGITWTLHSTKSGVGVTSIYDSATAVEIGRADTGYPGRAGTIHEVEIRDGIAGPIVGRWDGRSPHVRQRDEAGNIWTVNGTANAWEVIE